jgi:hypothetical protein
LSSDRPGCFQGVPLFARFVAAAAALPPQPCSGIIPFIHHSLPLLRHRPADTREGRMARRPMTAHHAMI